MNNTNIRIVIDGKIEIHAENISGEQADRLITYVTQQNPEADVWNLVREVKPKPNKENENPPDVILTKQTQDGITTPHDPTIIAQQISEKVLEIAATQETRKDELSDPKPSRTIALVSSTGSAVEQGTGGITIGERIHGKLLATADRLSDRANGIKSIAATSIQSTAEKEGNNTEPEHYRTGIKMKIINGVSTPTYRVYLFCETCGKRVRSYEREPLKSAMCRDCGAVYSLRGATEKGIGYTSEFRDLFGNFAVKDKLIKPGIPRSNPGKAEHNENTRNGSATTL